MDRCGPNLTGGPSPPRLRLRVTAAAERALRGGHPWLFSESVRETNREGVLGELGFVYDRQDRLLAIGLFDPESPLRLRRLHVGKPVTIDQAWWTQHLEAALAGRAGLFDQDTTGHRWIHGENDNWPGLVLDRYDRTLVLKLYSAVWLPRLADLVPLIQSRLAPERLVLRLSRNIQVLARDGFRLHEGLVLAGPPFPNENDGTTPFRESGLLFEAEVVRGQKTGFFLDQRENRRQVGALAAGRDVLNAFSFTGGFSLYAARGGARSVTDLDISAHALRSAERNWALNQADRAVASCRHESVQTDVFAWLGAARTPQYDLVILDPPSLAKRESERAVAIQAYRKLVRDGLTRLRPGGILVAASCSAHVSAEEFLGAARESARSSGRRWAELQTTAHPPDHPANFAEAHYLKCLYARFE